MLFRIIFIIFVIAWLFFIFLIVCSYIYRNPYKLITVIGKKGAGKTTLITKLTFKYLKRGWKVYSNVEVPGAYIFDPQEIGKLQFDSNSVVFIDEIGLVFNNRDFAKWSKDKTEWFKLQRHYKCIVYCFSQAHDAEVTVRRLTDSIYLLDSYFNVISIARKVNRKLTIVHPSGESESRIADDLEFAPIWLAPFGGMIITWLPAWNIYFNSFDAPVLPLQNFRYYEMPAGIEQRKLLARLHALLLAKCDRLEYVIHERLWSMGLRPYVLSDYKINVPQSTDQDDDPVDHLTDSGSASDVSNDDKHYFYYDTKSGLEIYETALEHELRHLQS